MEPRIVTLPEKKLVGNHLTMSLADNKTFELWQSFMRRRKEITNNCSSNLFSIQVYSDAYDFKNFDFAATFEKWATAEVHNFKEVPVGMETLVLKGGLYAVFIHRGPASTGYETFRYIFASWIPQCPYELDNRPHFELLGEKYKNNDPASEEEIWIPIKKK
jgi:AraC family transcriptional regulator